MITALAPIVTVTGSDATEAPLTDSVATSITWPIGSGPVGVQVKSLVELELTVV